MGLCVAAHKHRGLPQPKANWHLLQNSFTMGNKQKLNSLMPKDTTNEEFGKYLVRHLAHQNHVRRRRDDSLIILISSEDIFELPKPSNLSSYCLLACCTIGWSSIWLAGWLNHCRVAAPEGKFKALVERLGRFTLQTSGRSNA